VRAARTAVAIAVGVTACGTPAPVAEPPDPGIVHVHGLDVDAEDGSLYIATHTGLFRAAEGEPAQRIGERWHDLMGFTVAGPGDLIASGHPDLRDEALQRPDAPPLLGLVESSDQGSSWQETSLLGEVDFHALQASHGLVYGADSTSGAFMVSQDRRTWETRSQPSLLDFAVSPSDPEAIVGISERGVLRSADGGRTWDPVAAPPLTALAWGESGLIGIAPDGAVLRAEDEATNWQQLASLAGPPEALHAEGATLYAAATDRGVLRSDDGGATWSTVVQP